MLASLIYLVWQYIADKPAERQAASRASPAAMGRPDSGGAGGGGSGGGRIRPLARAQGGGDSRCQGESSDPDRPSENDLLERYQPSGTAGHEPRCHEDHDSSPANALLGAGGGGWNATYTWFQPYPYFSTETHDDFMQTGVETGFPGLLDFLLIWGFFIAAAWACTALPAPEGARH